MVKMNPALILVMAEWRKEKQKDDKEDRKIVFAYKGISIRKFASKGQGCFCKEGPIISKFANNSRRDFRSSDALCLSIV